MGGRLSVLGAEKVCFGFGLDLADLDWARTDGALVAAPRAPWGSQIRVILARRVVRGFYLFPSLRRLLLGTSNRQFGQ